MRPFLLIAPFAPYAMVGAYRWVKIARHLPARGFRPIVLSATFPDDPRDPTLFDALPPEVEIVEEYLDPAILAVRAVRDAVYRQAARLRTPAPARPIQGLRPHRSINERHNPHVFHAARAAAALVRRYGAEAVVVSASPYSPCLVGVHLKRALRLPLVLDFRDPWSLHETGALEAPTGLSDRVRRAAIDWLERGWFEAADHVIINTRRALAAYQDRYPGLASKSSFVRNCFDLDLYTPPDPAPPPPSRFVILHLGTLRAETRVDDIGAALRRLIDAERLSPDEIVLRQVGRMTDYERARFEAMGLTPFMETVPPIPQRGVLAELRRAHVLLTMVASHVTLRVAAKTYDYLGSGMPIVSVTANPEVDELLAYGPDNMRVLPGDVPGLSAVLARHLARFRATGALPVPAPAPAELSSRAAADRVAAILDVVMRSR